MRSLPAVLVVVCCAGLLAQGCKKKDAPAPAAVAGPPAGQPAPAGSSTGGARPAVLAELADGSGAGGAPPPTEGNQPVFAERGPGVAWIAGGGAGKSCVVHNGKASRPYRIVGSVVVSPDGRRVAFTAEDGRGGLVVVDGVEHGPFGEIGPPVFSADGAHVAFPAKRDGAWRLVVDGKEGPAVSGWYTAYELSADGARLAFVEADPGETTGRLVVVDTASRQETVVETDATLLLVSPDRSRLASLAEGEGRRQALTFTFERPGEVRRGKAYDGVTAFDYRSGGASLAYLAKRGSEEVLVLDGQEVPAPKEPLVGYPVPRPDGKGVGAFFGGAGGVTLREFFTAGASRERSYDEAEMLVYARQGGAHAYAARRGDRWFVVVNGKEGPAFERVVSPAFSPDGKSLVYRARQDGKRFVVIADAADGRTLRQLPAYEQVFPVQFTADGRSLAFGVKDGRQIAWKVEPL